MVLNYILVGCPCNKSTKRSYNRCCSFLMESSTKEVGMILPVFLRTLPDMLRDKWPSNENNTLCVIWSQIERHRFAVICATPGTTGLVTNFSRNISKNSFPSNSSQFSISATILTKVLWLHHYMIMREFASFNLLLIPSYQLTHPSLPASFQSLTSFDACYAA